MFSDKPRLFFSFALTALIVGAAWILLSRVPPGASTQGKIPAPRQDFLAPDFELTSSTGETVRLSDLRGKPLIVNFWASWCEPCRYEMPAMQRVYQEYSSQELEILAVNSTSQDTLKDALDFAAQQGLTFPILLDQQGDVSSTYRVQALPSTFFVRPDGVIQEVVVGGPMSEALLRTRVERLLSELEP